MKKAKLVIHDPEGPNNSIFEMDVIEHEGHAWLVPRWLDYQADKVTMPERIILLDVIPHSKTEAPGMEYVINSPVPKAVFDGHVPPELEGQYVVIEAPDIRLPLPGTTN